jgi:hypothetical protein
MYNNFMKNLIARVGGVAPVVIAAVANFAVVSMVYAQGFEAASQAAPGGTGGANTFPTPPVNIPQGVLTSTTGISNFFCTIVDWVFWGLIVLAVVMFLVGGYRYVTSGGEAERVSKANRTLLYAAIAVAVALIAAGIPSLINTFLGGSSNLTACGGIAGF